MKDDRPMEGFSLIEGLGLTEGSGYAIEGWDDISGDGYAVGIDLNPISI